MKLDAYRSALAKHADAISHRERVKSRLTDLTRQLEWADQSVLQAQAALDYQLKRLNEAIVLDLVELPHTTEQEATDKLRRDMSNAWRKEGDS